MSVCVHVVVHVLECLCVYEIECLSLHVCLHVCSFVCVSVCTPTLIRESPAQAHYIPYLQAQAFIPKSDRLQQQQPK